MQIKELITFYVNELSKTLDVSFRLEVDGDEEIRNDSILLEEVDNFGFKFLKDDELELYDDEIIENYENDYDYDIIDESEIISFLNEYYMINSNKIPPVEPF